MSYDLVVALQKLANYRVQHSRASEQILKEGLPILERQSWKRLGDEGWLVLEQLALAAIDVGRLDVADDCISALSLKFPGSSRVECLIGIRREATGQLEDALKYYEAQLELDDSNAAFWKRKISVLRRLGHLAQAIEELSAFLDTFYTDAEGWLELADIYSSCNQYENALKTLQHVLLLAPQNPFYVLQAAETAYTAGDVPLAVRLFLNVIDMTDADSDAPADSIPEGITVRGWYGVKLCARRLLKEPRLGAQSVSQTAPPQHVKLLDELATERLLTAYSSGNGPVNGREALVKWLEDK